MSEQTAGSLGLCGPESMARERERLGLPQVPPRADREDLEEAPSLPETRDRAACATEGRRITAESDLYVPPQLFAVEKDWDTAGKTSGRVAWGYRWPDGLCVTRTIGQEQAPAMHPNLEAALAWHADGDGTLHASFH